MTKEFKQETLKRRIDENGFFLEDVLTEETGPDLIEVPAPGGLYKPRWTGTDWVEGLTQEEIDAIKKSVPLPSPILEELASALNNAMKAIMLLSLE